MFTAALKHVPLPGATFKNMSFDLDVPPGSYKVKVSALGLENISQLGVGACNRQTIPVCD